MSRYQTLGYSLLGGSGAASSLVIGQNCLAGCSGCFGCVAFGGILVGWTMINNLRNRERRNP